MANPFPLALLLAAQLAAQLAAASDPSVIALPVIAGKEFDVTRFGAVGDGATACAGAIQEAVRAAAAAGGGRVVIPEGRFLSGPIVLDSNIDLHLADGAVLLMDEHPDIYPVVKNDRQAFISANKCHDIRLSGNGTIDGQGQSWWKAFLLVKSGVVKSAPRRPQMIRLANCERVEVNGITTLNPPNTHYSFKQCRDLTIRGIKAEAPDDSPNTDALNLSSARNVLISGCGISTGDDNIVLLCGPARTPGVPEVANVTIRDCRLGFGHGISIGSYTSGGVRDVMVENVSFDGTTSAIRMKSDRDRGGVVEKLHYRNITMKNVRFPIHVTSYYPKPPASPAADTATKGKPLPPVWRDVLIEDVKVSDAGNSIVLWGLPEQPIRNFTFRNVNIEAKTGALVFHARNIRFSNVRITPSSGPPLRVFDARTEGMAGVGQAGEPVKFK